MGKYRILSLDGGGIRGVITVVLLQRLSAEAELGDWLDQVDLIAGTSTGGLIALALAHGTGLQRVRNLYEMRGSKIFDDSWLDDLIDIGTIAGAEYSSDNLRTELKAILGQTRLSQLKKKVLITSFDLDNEDPDPTKRMWKPKLFHNFGGPSSDGKELAYKVGLYTAAAPTYFPAVDGYVDGGVYANNPSVCALAQTQDPRIPKRPAMDDVVLFSVGTGQSLVYIPGKNLDWGYAQWAKPLVNLILDGTGGIADYQCKRFLGDRYHRLAPAFPPGVSIPLDAVKRIAEMVAFAEDVDLRPAADWLRKHWAS